MGGGRGGSPAQVLPPHGERAAASPEDGKRLVAIRGEPGSPARSHSQGGRLMGDDQLTRYLDDLRARLRGMPPEEVDDIGAELRSHVLESLRENGPHGVSQPGAVGATAPEALAPILERLGAPENLAAMYRADRQLEQALCPAAHGFRPLRLVTGVARWASVSLAGAGALLILLAGYWVAVSFCIAAATKLFAPARVGLFRLPG